MLCACVCGVMEGRGGGGGCEHHHLQPPFHQREEVVAVVDPFPVLVEQGLGLDTLNLHQAEAGWRRHLRRFRLQCINRLLKF